jgi:glutamate-1-semialdehyde 2,1-aminomutase
MDHGKGCRLYDVDGNEYIDLMLAYGALPLGHAHPRIVEVVRKEIEGGSLFATASEVEVGGTSSSSSKGTITAGTMIFF